MTVMSSMNHQQHYKGAINTCLFYSYHKQQVLNTCYIDTKHFCHQNKTAAELVMREGEGADYVKKCFYL